MTMMKCEIVMEVMNSFIFFSTALRVQFKVLVIAT